MRPRCRALPLVYFAFGCAASFVGAEASSTSEEGEEVEHDHYFEYAAVYAVDAGNTTLVAVGGEDVDEETLAFMIVPTVTADAAGLHEAEEEVEDGKSCSLLLL